MTFYASQNQLFLDFNAQEKILAQSKKAKERVYCIAISKHAVDEVMEIYRWRTETQFPIYKIKQVELLSEDADEKEGLAMRQIFIILQEPLYLLSEIHCIPLFKVLYLIKETLIGLQRLENKFGSFLFNEKMIFVDQTGKCKVWINQNIQLNSLLYCKKKQQSEFLKQVCDIFKRKTSQTKQSNAFYDKINFCQSFSSALEFIDSFIAKQKIKVIYFFKLQQPLNGMTSFDKKKKKNDCDLLIQKKPQFLNNLEFNAKKEDNLPLFRSSFHSNQKVGSSKDYCLKLEMKISAGTTVESQESITQIFKRQTSLAMGSEKTIPNKMGCCNSIKLDRYQNMLGSCELNIRAAQSFYNQISAVDHRSPDHQSATYHEISRISSPKFQISSRQNSADKQQKLTEKKKQVFSCNGWQLKVDSLFSDFKSLKKSYDDKNIPLKSNEKDSVRLDLLDQCTSNMYQSYLADNQESFYL